MITGPSKGSIGAQTGIDIAGGKPALIILAGRAKGKVQPVIDQIAQEHPDILVKFVELDLTDNASVRKAAQEVKGITVKLDILFNNAGIMAVETFTMSKDGIELQFAANHVGHFLLTNLLLPEIRAAGSGARIVNVSSTAFVATGVRFDDPNFAAGAEYNPWLAYAQSKTANILFAQALASRFPGTDVAAFALQPGFVLESSIMQYTSPDSLQEAGQLMAEGAGTSPESLMTPKPLVASSSTSLFGALAPGLAAPSNDAAVAQDMLVPHATGAENQEELWKLSEKLVGQKFAY